MADKKQIVLPNFIIVGAPKAGTTSIARYLDDHPEVFISSEKEPFYFLPNILEDTNTKDPMYGAIEKRAHLTKESYESLFESVKDEKAIGEATVHYLYHYDEVIPKVKEELGDVKIIIVLRDPTKRAFSNYTFQKGLQFDSFKFKTFEEELEQEQQKKDLGFNSFWYFKSEGLYFKQVKAYLDNFNHVHVCFLEDFKKDKDEFIKSIYSFLGVDPNWKPDFRVYNQTEVPVNKFVHFIYFLKYKLGLKNILPTSWARALRKKLYKKQEEKINPETEQKLRAYYKSDIQQLEELLGKDLSEWYD